MVFVKFKINNYGFSVLRLLIIGSLIFGFIFFITRKSGFSFVNTDTRLDHIDAALLPDESFIPEKNENRINMLILGIRGIEDENGGLLADTIMLMSMNKETGDTVLLSIPRDLYVYTSRTKREKLNAVYAIGESLEWGGGGLTLSKKIISQIVGQHIDYAVSVDFEAFEKFIDILGGININRKTPFIEYRQWENYPEHIKEGNEMYWRLNEEEQRWEFYIEEGDHSLDGETALYYVRARFSSDDFDRARRQQQVVSAIKDKLFSLGVLANPIKVFNILDLINDNIKRDFGILEIKNLLSLALKAQDGNIARKSLDISPEGLLYSVTVDDLYVLLPVGNTYEKIREMASNIFK
jgi:polyisoprenyl-teichoic acid--peptidoglycan teichoic acid transferase